MKDLTASDLLVSLDLSDSSYVSDTSTSEPELVQDQPTVAAAAGNRNEPELVQDQPTVAAAAGNLINPDTWMPIATPRAPIPEEHCIPPKHRNLKPPLKRKQPVCRSARICVTKPKATNPKGRTKKGKDPSKPQGSFLPDYL
ncbi:hypothetical protein PCANC_06414 [Puccinia coronata f. sp. avenae]|uniref:Uncharacterized protein n=1 Tax=Puccinia coronata f. sp. avenae TaxID=200324 RepID=A0A2N5VVR2_9BASI|nr:hypothetical protein PCANC_06414 [Puccinia coronata f. sp. avenae]